MHRTEQADAGLVAFAPDNAVVVRVAELDRHCHAIEFDLDDAGQAVADVQRGADAIDHGVGAAELE